MAFSILLRTVSSLQFDLIIFDTAPTGHTLKLLSFPQVLSQFLGKIGPLTSIFGKVSHFFIILFYYLAFRLNLSFLALPHKMQRKKKRKIRKLFSPLKKLQRLFLQNFRTLFANNLFPVYSLHYRRIQLLLVSAFLNFFLCMKQIDWSSFVIFSFFRRLFRFSSFPVPC